MPVGQPRNPLTLYIGQLSDNFFTASSIECGISRGCKVLPVGPPPPNPITLHRGQLPVSSIGCNITRGYTVLPVGKNVTSNSPSWSVSCQNLYRKLNRMWHQSRLHGVASRTTPEPYNSPSQSAPCLQRHRKLNRMRHQSSFHDDASWTNPQSLTLHRGQLPVNIFTVSSIEYGISRGCTVLPFGQPRNL